MPLYPVEPADDAEKAIKERYGKILGSAVNPVLREGNSDRRVAGPVKKFAQKNPHPMPMSKYDAAGNKVSSMPWTAESKTRVAGMTDGDFFGSELSQRCAEKCEVRIEHVSAGGDVTVLKPSVKLQAGEVIDASRLSAAKLREYIEAELTQAKADGVMVSVHLKATMMKISDPIMFGHVVSVFFKDAFAKHADAFARPRRQPEQRPRLALREAQGLARRRARGDRGRSPSATSRAPSSRWYDSDKGITNLASGRAPPPRHHQPARAVGRDHRRVDAVRHARLGQDVEQGQPARPEDVKCLIPDRSYASMYEACVQDCKAHGQFDVTTMGNVSNVGLMAQKAEEYGSHDKTFEIKAEGHRARRRRRLGRGVFEHSVEKGDIWRMCQTKDAPIRDWVRLAVSRARATGAPTSSGSTARARTTRRSSAR